MKDAITAPSEAYTKGEQQRMMEENARLRYDVVAMRKLHYIWYVFAHRSTFIKKIATSSCCVVADSVLDR